MGIESAIQRMNMEIAKRKSEHFGIKVGIELYRELYNAGHISIEKFSVFGTGTFELEFPAYQKKVCGLAGLGDARRGF